MKKSALLAVLLFGIVSNAWGHAVLLGSSPGAEQVVDDAPAEVVLNFNENVGPIFFKVLDAQGVEVGSAGEIRVEGNDVFLPLGETLANGTYVITYRVISADTHPVGGSFLFAIGEPISAGTDVGAGGGEASGWRIPVALNRWLLYGAGTLAAGSGLLLVLLQLPAGAQSVARRQGRIAAALAGLALLLSPGLGGAEMLAGGGGALFSAQAWLQGLGSTLGPSLVIGVPGAILLWWAFGKPSPAGGALLVGAALVIGSYLVTGHAATAPPAWLMALVVALHLLAVSFWFAALWPLKTATAELEPAAAVCVLEQFSGKGVWAVALLGFSGIGITFVQMQGFEPFFTTDYGNRLGVKIILFVLIVGIALLNKFRLTAKVAAGADGAKSMGSSIRFEYALIVLILGLAVSLTLPSPPRALAAGGSMAEASGSGFTAEVARDDLVATVEVTPAKPGENMIMISFADPSGSEFPIQEVNIFLALPSASLDGIEKSAEAMGPSMYHITASEMIIPGTWELRIDAFVDDFDKRILRTQLEIR